MLRKSLSYTFNIIILVITFLLFIKLEFNVSGCIKLILFFIIIISYVISLIFNLFNFKKISRLFYLIFISTFIISIGYFILYKTNLLDSFSSVNGLKQFILSTGNWGIFTYISIQCAQVVFLPVPAAIICIVGSLIYGPFLGGLYCSIGVIIGSYISFFIGKTFGHRIVSWIVGEEITNKYSQLISNRGGFFLIIAFLLPMFPDDILCLIAGITNINVKSFLLITLITRPIGVICMSYFGSGHLIPFSGWGIYAWAGILVVAIILVVIIYKYQDKMQEAILNKVFKSKLKN